MRTILWNLCRLGWRGLALFLSTGARERLLMRWVRPFGPPPPRTPREAAANARGEPGVTIIGLFSNMLGLGQSARSLAAAMRRSPIPTETVDFPLGMRELLARGGGGFLHGEYRVNLWCLNGFEMFLGMNKYGFDEVRRKMNVCYWYWELETFPEFWRPALSCVDEIWTASAFTADCFRKAAPPGVAVRTIPPPIEAIPRPGDWRTHFSLPRDRFLALVIFDFNSTMQRKNPMAAIRAAALANRLRPSLPLHIVVKTRNADKAPEDFREMRERLAAVEHTLIDADLTRDEILGLYQACDAVLNLHRSEGFGLVPAEAMALGKAVVATDWSATTDFMTPDNSWPVPYRLIRNPRACGPYPKDALWAEADTEAAARALVEIADNPEAARERGARARATIARLYSAEAARRAFEERFAVWEDWRRGETRPDGG